jgi:uncharacterized protein
MLAKRVRVDVAIVGAGPAGLAASSGVSTFTDSFLLIEGGKEIGGRDRAGPTDLGAGVGGAGLFSDGKFSFFPAASRLWELPDRAALERAYAATVDALERQGLACPPMPSRAEVVAQGEARGEALEAGEQATAIWARKDYPSRYLSIEGRVALTRELFAPSAGSSRHRLMTRVVELRSPPGGKRGPHELLIERSTTGERELVEARRVVLAGGRFQPLWLGGGAPGIGRRFRRFEYGVRIEDRADNPFFSALVGVDPKYTCAQPSLGVEWRTFCCCRQGEVVQGDIDGLVTASGRADGPRTGRSNVGFLARVLDPAVAARVHVATLAAARRERSLFAVPVGAVAGPSGQALLAGRFGAEGSALLLEGIRLLLGRYPTVARSPGAMLLGPCVEGVGDYPRHEGLRVPGTGVWVAGDCTGGFRGLVAALVSGRYVAEQLRYCLAEPDDQRAV